MSADDMSADDMYTSVPKSDNDVDKIRENLMTREHAVNVYKSIEKIKAKPDQRYCLVVYFLSKEISPEGCRGMWYFLGTYETANDAEKQARLIIEKTGIRSIYYMKTCTWQEIDTKFQIDRTKLVPLDKDGKLRQQRDEEYQEEMEKYRIRREIEEEKEDELLREGNPESLEHYIRQWYLIIKAQERINKLEEELQSLKKDQDQSIQYLQSLYHNNPDHENNWIPQLEKRLPKRGEQYLLERLKTGRTLLKSNILP